MVNCFSSCWWYQEQIWRS